MLLGIFRSVAGCAASDTSSTRRAGDAADSQSGKPSHFTKSAPSTQQNTCIFVCIVRLQGGMRLVLQPLNGEVQNRLHCSTKHVLVHRQSATEINGTSE